MQRSLQVCNTTNVRALLTENRGSVVLAYVVRVIKIISHYSIDAPEQLLKVSVAY
jgi:hypothetical protein